MNRAFWKGRRVLLTGHTGFKGSWLGLWLAELGAEVAGLALAPSTTPSVFEVSRLATRIQSVIGDIRDAPLVEKVFAEHRPEVVLHLAAQALVGPSYEDPVGTFSTNVVGTAQVLDGARRSAATRAVVVVTSDKCYENRGWAWGYRETDALGGHDPYSASKGATELVAASFHRSFLAAKGCGLATVRAGNVIGGGDFTAGRLVPDCLKAFAANTTVQLRNPSAVRPWQHVLEPLYGYLAVAERLFTSPEEWSTAWNFGPEDADARTVGEVVQLCARAWGNARGWTQEPGHHPHEAQVLRLDSSQARMRLGWRPRWHLEEAVERTVAWQKAMLQGADMRAVMCEQLVAHGGLQQGPRQP